MSFKDCYKAIFNTFTDYSEWTAINAKIIDLCTDSADEDISLYAWKPYTTHVETYLFSNGMKTGKGCIKLPFLGLTGYIA